MFYAIVPTVVGASLIALAVAELPSASDLHDRQAAGQLLQYQTFLFTASIFFERHPPPAANTAYPWNALRSVATPAMKGSEMPPHWKAVRRPDGDWVVCTELSEASVARLPSLFPTPMDAAGSAVLPTRVPTSSITAVVGAGGGSMPGTPSYLVLDQEPVVAVASANLCAGT